MTISTTRNLDSANPASAFRIALFGSAAMIALALPGVAAAAQADEAQPAKSASVADDATGNDIVVTATKRERTLQDTPVAVSVTTADTIQRAAIRDIKDLSSLVPSLRVSEHQAAAQTDFIIRGFGNGANNPGIEPSVGVFIDGVYRSRSAAQIGDLPDVKRVEVLRGPQSTLFGKNASVGVVSVVTAEPKFKFGGNLEASYGNKNAAVVKGVITGPLSKDIAFSIAGGYNRRDGFVQDLGTGNKTNNRNRWFVRGQLLYAPDDNLKIRLIADYSQIDENCCAVVNVQAGPTAAVINALGGKFNPVSNPFGNVVYNNFDSTNKIKDYGFSGQIDYNAGPLKLTSITAYRKNRLVTNQDIDFTNADLLGRNNGDVGIRTFTQEFRAATDLDGPFNFLVGAFYFNEKISEDNQIGWGTVARPYANFLVQSASGCALAVFAGPCQVPNPNGNTPTSLEATLGQLEGNPSKYTGQFFAAGQGLNEQYRLSNSAISVFGQTDFKVADRLTLTAGISYTKDNKRFSTNVVSSDVFAGINLDAAAYAPFRNSLLRGGAVASGVGSALGLGRSASTAEITAFASGTSAAGAAGAAAYANQIVPGAVAFANANQNNPAANPLNGLKPLQFFPPFLNVPNVLEPGTTSDSNVSYTARLAFQASKQINLYATVATGFKASSINLSRDSRPALASQGAIANAGIGVNNLSSGSRFASPEKSTVYEAGLKANWGVASVNFAVFKEVINGFQSNLFTGTGFFLSNAGKESVFGFEFEGMVHPVPELTLTAALTYLKPKYDSFVNSPLGNASGITPAGIPPIALTMGAEWNHGLANGDRLILRGDWHYESTVQIEDALPGFNTANPDRTVTNFQPSIDAARPFTRTINEFDASMTYQLHQGLDISIWGRNLSNNRYLTTIFDSPAQKGSVSAYPNQPRTFGGSVRYKF